MSNRIAAYRDPSVSNKFVAIPTRDVVQVVESTLTELGLGHNGVSLLSGARGGDPADGFRRVLGKVELPDLAFSPGGDVSQRLVPTVCFRNGNDGTTALAFNVGAFRFVCSNGLYLGQSVFQTRVIHTDRASTWRDLEALPGAIREAVEFVAGGGLELEVEQASEERVENAIEVVASLSIPKRAKERALSLIINGTGRPEDNTNSTWGVYQTVNEAIRQTTRSLRAAALRDATLLDDVRLLAQAQMKEAA